MKDKDKERIKKFIELQNKDLKFEDIALELGIAKTTLRVFLNRNGYKMYNGKYKLKDESSEFKQIEFEQSKNSSKKKSTKIKENKNTANKEVKIKKEKEEVAAMQSKLALDIANKTLPYFRSINEESLEKICRIIKDEINSDAVSITDKNEVLAYVGVGEDAFNAPYTEISNITKCSIKENKILNIQVKKEESSISEKADLKTAMIIPLTDSQGVVGTLKIYYAKKYDMSHSKKSLAIGLSQIISTLMEISKIEKIENERKKSEIKALQRQINPHFLFNALNTITSFIRINPDKARKLIINLSTYMRYNLEVNDNLIDINKELEQVKAYVEIEKARFGDKLTVLYDIDENIEAKIPSLTIQPLVENAIIHGIRKNGGCGTVVIGVKKEDGYTRVWVENDVLALDLDVKKYVYSGEKQDNKIENINVHLRLKLIYGQGLNIYRLDPGTKMEFYI